ncbi:MAG: hypothetical protein AVDCRST_MAG85-2275, partial [uncultured Solirubrobacteraceae bacterium]
GLPLDQGALGASAAARNGRDRLHPARARRHRGARDVHRHEQRRRRPDDL